MNAFSSPLAFHTYCTVFARCVGSEGGWGDLILVNLMSNLNTIENV